MKQIFILAAAAFLLSSAQVNAEEGDDIQVLPEKAQACTLPASPIAIPEDATRDDLLNAKKQIAVFQGEVTVFRECLNAADANPDNTPGNKAAIVSSYNYSVEMEERVAERFNEAVRSYKERQAAADG